MRTEEPPWDERREIPDLQVRDAADQFDNARQLLQRQPPGSGVLLPYLNCGAIALELYMKSLGALSIHTPVHDSLDSAKITAKAPARAHSLLQLLEEIPDDFRIKLEDSYSTANPSQNLRVDLETLRGLFSASRYAYEKDKSIDQYPLELLNGLCSFLRIYIGGLKSVTRIQWKR